VYKKQSGFTGGENTEASRRKLKTARRREYIFDAENERRATIKSIKTLERKRKEKLPFLTWRRRSQPFLSLTKKKKKKEVIRKK